MLSLPRPLTKAFIRRFLHFSRFDAAKPSSYRAATERFALPAPLGVRRQRISDPVRGEWIRPLLGAKPDECILYLHGGAYVFGSAATHREFAGRLSRLSKRSVFLLEYRLAPEHPFPAAQADAVAAFRWLIGQGFDPSKIIVAGDSAGGNLVLSLALKLREERLPMPAGLVLMSPWTDLTCPSPEPSLARRDPMIDVAFGRLAARSYCGATDPNHPHLSPVFAELHGLPPMLIHVGSEEVLLHDSQRLAERARAHGVTVDLQVWDGMWHVWHLFAIVLPEARRAHRDIVRFINTQLRSAAVRA